MARSRSLVNSLDPHRANDAALFTVNSERIPRIPRSLVRTHFHSLDRVIHREFRIGRYIYL